MNIKITVRRTVPGEELKHIMRFIPKEVRKEIDLPSSDELPKFKKDFVEYNGIMLFARDEDSGEIVGTVSMLKAPIHYITREALVSKEDPVPLQYGFVHEIVGAYIPEQYRRFGIYSKLRDVLEIIAIKEGIQLYSVVRHHPRSKQQALELLSRLLKRDKTEIERNYDEICRELDNKSIPRIELARVKPLIGLVHPDAVSVLHRWSRLVEEGEAQLVGYWIAAFSPVFLFTPSQRYYNLLLSRTNNYKYEE